MPKSETIRSLERGLQVFKVLQTIQTATLLQLHQRTGISKPSLLRILLTLTHEGMVHRRIGDGRYHVSTKPVRVTRKDDPFDYVAEVATPLLDRLCQKIIWPSDLAVPAGDHMEIRETSRTLSPFVFNSAGIGNQINWLLTGHGRAYLAYCPKEERESILARLRGSANRQNWLASHPGRLDKIFEEVRRCGYATRDPSFSGGLYEHPSDDGLSGIAVPIRTADRVHATINILWVRRALTIKDMVLQHLPDLQRVAKKIAASASSKPA